MRRIFGTPLWGEIAKTERITGWLALSFFLTLALGNKSHVLWKIAEHSAARTAWAMLFLLTGITLILLPRWRDRRRHLFICALSATFWLIFGAQAWVINAIGAAAIAAICVCHLGQIALILYQGD